MSQFGSNSCPLKEKGGKKQMIVTNDDDFLAMSDKPVKAVVKKLHNLTKTIENNETLPKRHIDNIEMSGKQDFGPRTTARES